MATRRDTKIVEAAANSEHPEQQTTSSEAGTPLQLELNSGSNHPSSRQEKKVSEQGKHDHSSSSIASEQPDNHTEEPSTTSNLLKRNAFSALMAPKPKQPKTAISSDTTKPAKPPASRPSFTFGLLPYITQPNTFPPGTIISSTPHTILIRDLYPKALVHLLLLPKDPTFYNLDPFEAFQPTSPQHTAFLELMRQEAHTASLLAASELSRLVSSFSKSCKARNEALMSPPSPSEDAPPSLPPARDFTPSIKIGIHASPSMSTLHIHIISEDNCSPHLKTKKHYNSFNTDFFVGLHGFPLDESHVALTRDGQERLIKRDMKCWKCGRDFGNKFKLLKEHLEEEYREWREI